MVLCQPQGPVPKPPLNLLVSPQSLARASHARRLQTWMQIKPDVPYLRAWVCLRAAASARGSFPDRKNGRSLGWSKCCTEATRAPALHRGWKAIYLLHPKQKQTPREAGGWLFLSTIRSSLLLIKSKSLQVLRTFPTPHME